MYARIAPLLAATLMLVLATMFWLSHQKRAEEEQMENSAMAYANTCLPAVLKDWSSHELITRLSRDLSERWDQDHVTVDCERYRQELGDLVELSTLNSLGATQYTAGGPRTFVIISTATFARGQRGVELCLIREEGAWKINGFIVERQRNEFKTTQNR